ncbi:hypothetical protein BDQ17DRAFT_1329850 [Cyathus striatus]|nr:hypothetical protein BDQ17DRAFT_1329850 [Cyathus striatus]
MSRRSSISLEPSAPTSDKEAHESHVQSNSENGAEDDSTDERQAHEIDVQSNSEVGTEVSDDDDDGGQEPQAHELDIRSDSDAKSVVDEDGRMEESETCSEQDAAMSSDEDDRTHAAYRCIGNDAVELPVRPQEKRLEQPREGWGRNITEDVVMLTDASSDESDVEITPKKETIATKVKRVRGKLGALKQLPEMPLDILLEIFGQLDPLDLVRLTRTTKTLRRVLLERSAVGVWKQARGNLVNFPKCPKDMSEQAFACLILESHCQRLCTKCIMEDSEFTDLGQLNGRLTKKIYDKNYLKANNELKETMDNKKWLKWVRMESRGITRIREHARTCDYWLQSRAEDRTTMLEEIRKNRTEEIIKRLSKMGWTEVIENIPHDNRIQNHPLVAQKKELTERIWKNITPKLIEFLEEQKGIFERRRERERLEARVPLLLKFHEKYSESKPINAIIPPPSELYFFEPIHNLIMNTPTAGVELTIGDLENVAEGLDDFGVEWKREIELQLLRKVINGPLNQYENAPEILSKAKVAFYYRQVHSSAIREF